MFSVKTPIRGFTGGGKIRIPFAIEQTMQWMPVVWGKRKTYPNISSFSPTAKVSSQQNFAKLILATLHEKVMTYQGAIKYKFREIKRIKSVLLQLLNCPEKRRKKEFGP